MAFLPDGGCWITQDQLNKLAVRCECRQTIKEERESEMRVWDCFGLRHVAWTMIGTPLLCIQHHQLPFVFLSQSYILNGCIILSLSLTLSRVLRYLAIRGMTEARAPSKIPKANTNDSTIQCEMRIKMTFTPL